MSKEPGLRLGWAVAPAWLAAAMTEGRRDYDLGSPVLDQLTLAQLIASGSYDRHLRIVRRRYRQRRDALVQALTSVCPRWRLRGIAAGLHVVAELPAGTSETDVVDAAAEHGVLVQPLAPMRYSDGPPAIVIGYAGLASQRIVEAVGRLHAVAML